MPADRLQTQRFELKYIIPNDVAVRIRDFVQPYLEMDSFGARQEDRSYPVHSLYLDSSDLALHQSTINGDKNRYKLRVRFYENWAEAPVYFEIKRREDNAIYKERCPVHRDSVKEIVAGRLPAREDLSDVSPENERALLHFSRLLNELHARPITHVSYRREAWMSHDSNRVRVTMDRNVRTCPESTVRLEPAMDCPVSVFGDAVVLELKFSGRFPVWMRDLVRVFGLRQCSAAKYVDGVVRLEEENLIRVRFPRVHEMRGIARRQLRQIRSAPQFFQDRLRSLAQ